MKSILKIKFNIISFMLCMLWGQGVWGQQTVSWRSEPDNPNGLWTFGSTCEPAGDGQWFYQTWGGFRQAPDCFANNNDILFDNNARLSMRLNVRDYGVRRITFSNNNNSVRTINAEGNNRLFMNPNNGQPRIINESTATHVFNTPIVLGATIALRPVSGNLSFGAINVNNHFIDVEGSNGRQVNFNGIISGTGGIATKNSGVVSVLNAQNTFTGGISVENGTLQLNRTGGSTIPSGNSITISGGTLRVSSNQTLSNLTLTSGSLTIDSGATLTLTGNVTIPDNFTITNNGTLVIEGTLTDNRATKTFGGTVRYAASSGSQSVVGATYNNLELNGNSTKNLSANATINGNLTVNAGTLNLGTFTMNRASSGGTLTLAANTTLTIGSTNGFPANYSTKTIHPSSTVIYNGESQSIDGISEAVIYGNLELSGSGTKSFNSNPNVAGNFVTGGTASINVPAKFIFSGSSSQSIAGLIFNDLEFSGAGAKTFTSNASVSPTSAITFSGSPGTVDFDGVSNNLEFELRSTVAGTARIGNATGWTLNGQVRTERYVPAKRAWRLLTAPLKGNTNDKISNNWQGTTNEGLLLFSPATFQSQTMTGYAPGGSSPNIWRYNNAWQSIPNLTEEPLFSSERNNAFLVFATGPHGSSNITSGQTETTLKPKGQLFTGDPQGNVTITGLTTGQYHLIGNPFASPINTVALRGSNNSFTFWLLDPTLGSFGGYYTYNGSYWTPETPAESNTNIQSGQGFFVRSASASTFTFNESHKVEGNSNTWFEKQSVQNISENKIRVLLDRQTNTQWQLVDGILSVSGSTYANEVDAQDALKVSNFNENIQFRNGTTNLAIEYLNLPTMATEQPIRLTGTTATSYRLRVRTEGFASLDVQPVLQDTQSGTNHLIPTDGSTLEIPFTGVVSNANTPDTRFKIVYQQVLGVEQPISSSLQVYPNPVTEGYFNVSVPNVNEAATYQVSNYLGQVVQQGVIEYGKNTIFITSQAAGVYLIKLTQNGAVYTAKVVKK